LFSLVNNPGCADTGGNITVSQTVSNVCDVTGLLSQWLVAGSYTNMPISATIPVLICVDGQPLCNPFGQCTALGVNCTLQKFSNCLNCSNPTSHTISVTFNRSCMLNALIAWHTQLGSQYDGSKWLIEIAATGCGTCD